MNFLRPILAVVAIALPVWFASGHIMHHEGDNPFLLLRIAVDDSQAACVMSCKYGAPVGEAPRLLRIAAELGLRVRGVSFHVGSGQPDTHAVCPTPRGSQPSS